MFILTNIIFQKLRLRNNSLKRGDENEKKCNVDIVMYVHLIRHVFIQIRHRFSK